MEKDPAIRQLRKQIEQNEAELMRLRLLSKTAADSGMRAQNAARAEAAEVQGEILRRKLKQLTSIN